MQEGPANCVHTAGPLCKPGGSPPGTLRYPSSPVTVGNDKHLCRHFPLPGVGQKRNIFPALPPPDFPSWLTSLPFPVTRPSYSAPLLDLPHPCKDSVPQAQQSALPSRTLCHDSIVLYLHRPKQWSHVAIERLECG